MVATKVVYALSLDGLTFRYVGCTAKTAAHRLKGHIHEANKPSADRPLLRWIRKHGGDAVIATVLEDLADDATYDDLYEREAHHIARLRALGHELLNCNDGGYGHLGTTEYGRQRISDAYTDERKAAAAERMRKVGLARRGQAPHNVGVPMTDEARAQLSRSQRARLASDEARAARSALSKKQWESYGPEQREKAREASARGSHVRWHANRGITKDGCSFCV